MLAKLFVTFPLYYSALPSFPLLPLSLSCPPSLSRKSLVIKTVSIVQTVPVHMLALETVTLKYRHIIVFSLRSPRSSVKPFTVNSLLFSTEVTRTLKQLAPKNKLM